jgi:hypothetical protein
MTPGLNNLLFSAQVSQVPLQVLDLPHSLTHALSYLYEVLGQGEKWEDFHQKFESYLKHLNGPGVSDDDIVVIMDGFDVLLFPSFGNLLEVIDSSVSHILHNSCLDFL